MTNTFAQLLGFVIMVADLLQWVIVAYAIISWLVAFNVVNHHSPFIRRVIDILDRIMAPMLRPIRRIMPDLGGIDLSPMVLWLVLELFKRLLRGAAMDAILAG